MPCGLPTAHLLNGCPAQTGNGWQHADKWAAAVAAVTREWRLANLKEMPLESDDNRFPLENHELNGVACKVRCVDADGLPFE